MHLFPPSFTRRNVSIRIFCQHNTRAHQIEKAPTVRTTERPPQQQVRTYQAGESTLFINKRSGNSSPNSGTLAHLRHVPANDNGATLSSGDAEYSSPTLKRESRVNQGRQRFYQAEKQDQSTFVDQCGQILLHLALRAVGRQLHVLTTSPSRC